MLPGRIRWWLLRLEMRWINMKKIKKKGNQNNAAELNGAKD